MPRDVFLALPYFDNMHRFLIALIMREGYQVKLIDVNDRPRAHGTSKYTNWGRLHGRHSRSLRGCVADAPLPRQGSGERALRCRR